MAIHKTNDDCLKNEEASTYLFSKNKAYYFSNQSHNFLFFNNDKKQGNMFLDVETWLFRFYKSVYFTKEKPSIAIFDGIVTCDKLKDMTYYTNVEYDNVNAILNQEPAISLFKSNQFDEIMSKILKSREDQTDLNDVFVVIDGIDEDENNFYQNISKYLSVSSSKNIYFVIVCYDKHKFDTTLTNLLPYFNLHFVCNKNKIKKFTLSELGKTTTKGL